jgi:ABC-type Na+ efflux pump permease subunit
MILPWVILGAVWAAAGYQAWFAYRKAKMAEPANPVKAIAARIKIAGGYIIALVILLLGAIGAMAIANAEQNKIASYACLATVIFAILGVLALWKWFFRRRPKSETK